MAMVEVFISLLVSSPSYFPKLSNGPHYSLWQDDSGPRALWWHPWFKQNSLTTKASQFWLKKDQFRLKYIIIGLIFLLTMEYTDVLSTVSGACRRSWTRGHKGVILNTRISRLESCGCICVQVERHHSVGLSACVAEREFPGAKNLFRSDLWPPRSNIIVTSGCHDALTQPQMGCESPPGIEPATFC